MNLDLAGLPSQHIHELLLSAVVPRPIAWVSCETVGGQRNLAPFSFFNVLASAPPLVGFSVGVSRSMSKLAKDTLAVIAASAEFVVNIPSPALKEQVVISGRDFPAAIDEFEAAGVTPVPGQVVRCPRVAEAPVSLECRLHSIVPLARNSLVVGEVVYVHARDDQLLAPAEGQRLRFSALARMGTAGFATHVQV